MSECVFVAYIRFGLSALKQALTQGYSDTELHIQTACAMISCSLYDMISCSSDQKVKHAVV